MIFIAAHHASKIPIARLGRDLDSFRFPFTQQSSIPALTPLTLSALVRFTASSLHRQSLERSLSSFRWRT